VGLGRSALTPLANRFEAPGPAASPSSPRSRVTGAGRAIISTALRKAVSAGLWKGSATGWPGRASRSSRSSPGFVDTPMTAGIRRGPLFVSARRAGRAVHRATERRRDVADIPWFWRPIMAPVRTLPEPVFKRLRLRAGMATARYRKPSCAR
jgi:decaprenylphospho-beta-D-erythro-pentofuranosid-2-ulose 2-reductase